MRGDPDRHIHLAVVFQNRTATTSTATSFSTRAEISASIQWNRRPQISKRLPGLALAEFC